MASYNELLFDGPGVTDADAIREVARIIKAETAPEDPPTELELAEYQAQAEGWGPEFRAQQDQLRQLEEEAEERRQEQSRKRKREEEHRARWEAAMKEGKKMEEERIAMFRNDDRELAIDAERKKAWKEFMDFMFP